MTEPKDFDLPPEEKPIDAVALIIKAQAARIAELEAIIAEHENYSSNQARRITHLEQALRRMTT